MMKTALSVENLSKVYLRDKKKTNNINALNNITLDVKPVSYTHLTLPTTPYV